MRVGGDHDLLPVGQCRHEHDRVDLAAVGHEPHDGCDPAAESEDQAALRLLARDVAAREVAPKAGEHDETGEVPRDAIAAFAAADLFGVTIDEKWGGLGFGEVFQRLGGLAVDSNLGWKGPEKYVATVPQVFDLWQDPQERYDLFMNNFTERTWVLVTMNEEMKRIGETYVKYPPRPSQSEVYNGPITLSSYERISHVRELLAKEGMSIPMPTGN